MNPSIFLLIIIIFFTNLFWTYSLIRRIFYYAGYTEAQKRLQLILCILVPFIWPVIVHYVTRSLSNEALKEGREKSKNKWGNTPGGGWWPTSTQ